MTSNQMTALGAAGAMLTFALMGLPPTIPVYIKFVMGMLNAGVTFYLGQTNKGTTVDSPKVGGSNA